MYALQDENHLVKKMSFLLVLGKKLSFFIFVVNKLSFYLEEFFHKKTPKTPKNMIRARGVR
jgi:hypothetical protein